MYEGKRDGEEGDGDVGWAGDCHGERKGGRLLIFAYHTVT